MAGNLSLTASKRMTTHTAMFRAAGAGQRRPNPARHASGASHIDVVNMWAWPEINPFISLCWSIFKSSCGSLFNVWRNWKVAPPPRSAMCLCRFRKRPFDTVSERKALCKNRGFSGTKHVCISLWKTGKTKALRVKSLIVLRFCSGRLTGQSWIFSTCREEGIMIDITSGDRHLKLTPYERLTEEEVPAYSRIMVWVEFLS